MGNSFSFAARLLSALPPLSLQPPTRDEARQAIALFPLVGALLGLLTACAWSIAFRLWGSNHLVAGAVTLLVGMALTAGRLQSGLASAADGLASLWSGGGRSRAFAIMRDPRRGSAGVTALTGGAVLHLAFLAALPSHLAWGGLVLAGAIGRWATSFALAGFPFASASIENAESGHGLADAGPQEFMVATGLTVFFAFFLPLRGILIFAVVALGIGLMTSHLSKQLGGFNFQTAQAIGLAAEIGTLACLAVSLS